MGTTSWRGQIDRALSAIDHIGESKYQAKQDQDWHPGEAVAGLFSHGYQEHRLRSGRHVHQLAARAVSCRSVVSRSGSRNDGGVPW